MGEMVVEFRTPAAPLPRLLLWVAAGAPLAEAAGRILDRWRQSLDPELGPRPPAVVLAPVAAGPGLVLQLRRRVSALGAIPGLEDPRPCLHAALDQGATLVCGGTGEPGGGWRPGLLVHLPPSAPVLAGGRSARQLLLLLRGPDGDATLPPWAPRPHLLVRIGTRRP